MSGIWNCADSTIHPYGRYRETSPTPPLDYPFHGDRSLGADDVIPQVVVTLHRGQYIRFRQDREVLVQSVLLSH